jgi:hypothetical protein
MALAAISYPPQFAPANLRSAIQPRRSSARHPSPPTSSTVAADVVAGPRPRSNPHSARAADSPPTAVSSLGGFRTPAPGACGAVVMGPASENLHNNRPRTSGLLWRLAEHALASSRKLSAQRYIASISHKSQNYCFCGMGVTAVGPIAVNCRITSPSFAQT